MYSPLLSSVFTSRKNKVVKLPDKISGDYRKINFVVLKLKIDNNG